MKKFTSILTALLTVFSLPLVAQEFQTTISPGNVYAFLSCSNNHFGKYMYDAGEALYITDTIDETDSTTHFMFEASETSGWYYLKNIATGNYLQKMAVQSGVNLPLSPLKSSSDTVINELPAGKVYTVAISDTAHSIDLDTWYIFRGAGSYPFFVYEDASSAVLHSNNPEAFDTRYLVKFIQQDELIYAQTWEGNFFGVSGATADTGDKIPLVGETATAATFTYELLDTLAGLSRFTSSNDATTCFLHLQGNDSVCYWSGSGPQSQFYLYKAAIDSADAELRYDTIITVHEAELFQVSIANEDQMWIKNPDGMHINMYFGNPTASGVTYWTGSGDASRWHILKVKDGGDNMGELGALIQTVADFISRMDSAGKMGYYSVDAYEALFYDYDEAVGVYEYEESTFDDIAITIQILTNSLNKFLEEGVIKPEEGKYYRIKNNVSGLYAAMTDTAGIALEYNVDDPRTVWTFTAADDGGYFIKNEWLKVIAINAYPIYGFSAEEGSTWSLFNRIGDGRFQIHILTPYSGVSSSNEYWVTTDNILYAYSSIPESYWVIEECELPVYNYDDWTDYTLKIGGINATPSVVSVRYYNMTGVGFDSPQKGLNIKRSYLNNGKVKVEKLFIK